MTATEEDCRWVETACRAIVGAPGEIAEVHWPLRRKREVVLRLLRGEPAGKLSQELGVPEYKLEEWRSRALAGINAGLDRRRTNTLGRLLAAADRRIEVLKEEVERLRAELAESRDIAHVPDRLRGGAGKDMRCK